MRSASRPFLNTLIVGIARTPKRPAVIGLASTSSFTTRILSPCSLATSSRTGPTIRHGPHHVAQKSTRTGVSDFRTSCSKLWSVTTWGFPITAVSFVCGLSLLPPKRELLAGLFHRRFEANDGLQAVQPTLRVPQPLAQWIPLYESPASASNDLRQSRRAAELLVYQACSFVGDREEAENSVVIRDRLPEGNDAAVDPGGPVHLPQEDHVPPVVPDAVDEIDRFGRPAHETRCAARALGLGHEVRQHSSSLRMRGGQRAPLDVATDVHLEPQPVPRVDQLREDLRLRRLARDQRVLIQQAPPAFVGLGRIGRDAAFDELAVRRLDSAEQRIHAAQQRARVDLARG